MATLDDVLAWLECRQMAIKLDSALAKLDAVFRESDHPRDNDGKFGSGGGADPHTTAGGAKTKVYMSGDPLPNGPVVTREYRYGGQPDDPAPASKPKLDPAKIAATKSSSANTAAMMGHGETKTSPNVEPKQTASASAPSATKVPPFVAEFKKEYPTAAKMTAHLESTPKEKLLAAWKHLGGNDKDVDDPDAKQIKKLIGKELDNRASRGA